MKKAYLLLLIVLVVASCKKDKDETPTPATPAPSTNEATINSDPQVSFKLDGVSYSYVETSTNDISQSHLTRSTIGIGTLNEAAYGIGFDVNSTAEQIFSVMKGTCEFYNNEPDSAAFVAFFNPGNSGYANLSFLNEDGVEIEFNLGGVTWSTNAGATTQTGSVFTITDRAAPIYNWGLLVKIKCTFNCTLYDGMGNSKTLTDGVIVGYMNRD